MQTYKERNMIKYNKVKRKKVFKTNEYYKFKKIKGNRDIKESHLKRLIKAIKNENLLNSNPIIVNSNHEIIDGQHRLQAARKLKLPIFYTIEKDYTLSEVHILNANTKVWNLKDFLIGYTNAKIKSYQLLYGLVQDEKLTVPILLCMLGYQKSGKIIEIFKSGNFELTKEEVEEVKEIHEELKPFKHFFNCYPRRFVILYVNKIREHEKFDHKRLIKNLNNKKFIDKIKRQSNDREYIQLFEYIYNFGYRKMVHFS